MKKHFMLDLETLSTQTNAIVLSIGAVEFDPETGKVKKGFYHELNLVEQSHRHISASTVEWWFKQDSSPFTTNEKVPVRNALLLLNDFMGDEDKCVWACDPDFDCSILESLYSEQGLPTPWAYYQTRSVRTVRELAKIRGFELPKGYASHNALEDCIRQVGEVSAYLSMFG